MFVWVGVVSGRTIQTLIIQFVKMYIYSMYKDSREILIHFKMYIGEDVTYQVIQIFVTIFKVHYVLFFHALAS